MHYGIIKQILLYKNRGDRILVENIFKETTRNGKEVLQYVQLALTPRSFIIGSEAILESCYSETFCSSRTSLGELLSFYPLESIDFTIFKKSSRNSLKVSFEKLEGLSTRYFELESDCKGKTFWKIWNIYVIELNKEPKIWPFTASYHEILNRSSVSTSEENIIPQYPSRWIDKYLYLGEKRENEDQHRPIPIAGLESTEFIKLLNLKPQYFGSWAQSDHWVQSE